MKPCPQVRKDVSRLSPHNKSTTSRGHTMNTKRLSMLTVAVLGTLYGASPAFALPILGSDLASFAVLGASGVTNIPTSTVVGNVGAWSSGGANAITGFNFTPGAAVSDPQVTGGLVHAGTSVAQLAQGQLTNAITSLGLLGPGTILANFDLTGLTLAPGVYTVPAGTSNLTGALTLDGGGNANAAWVFQMPSTLITSPGSVVNVINTGFGSGVYWNVGSSATLGTSTSFQGNILADQSITLNTGATVGCGRILASVALVTMHTNTVGTGCGSNGYSGGLTVAVGGGLPTLLPVVPVPLPAALPLLAAGLAGLTGLGLRRRKQG